MILEHILKFLQKILEPRYTFILNPEKKTIRQTTSLILKMMNKAVQSGNIYRYRFDTTTGSTKNIEEVFNKMLTSGNGFFTFRA